MDVIDEIERLAKLKEAGHLSDAEYQQQKSKVLNSKKVSLLDAAESVKNIRVNSNGFQEAKKATAHVISSDENLKVGRSQRDLWDFYETLTCVSSDGDSEEAIRNHIDTFTQFLNEAGTDVFDRIVRQFCIIAIRVNNAAQRTLENQFRQYLESSKVSPEYDPDAYDCTVYNFSRSGAVSTPLNRLKFAQYILLKMRQLPANSEVTDRINSYYCCITQSIETLEKFVASPEQTYAWRSAVGCYIATYIYGAFGIGQGLND